MTLSRWGGSVWSACQWRAFLFGFWTAYAFSMLRTRAGSVVAASAAVPLAGALSTVCWMAAAIVPAAATGRPRWQHPLERHQLAIVAFVVLGVSVAYCMRTARFVYDERWMRSTGRFAALAPTLVLGMLPHVLLLMSSPVDHVSTSAHQPFGTCSVKERNGLGMLRSKFMCEGSPKHGSRDDFWYGCADAHQYVRPSGVTGSSASLVYTLCGKYPAEGSWFVVVRALLAVVSLLLVARVYTSRLGASPQPAAPESVSKDEKDAINERAYGYVTIIVCKGTLYSPCFTTERERKIAV